MAVREYKVTKRRQANKPPAASPSLYIPHELIDYIDEIALKENLSRSRVVSNIIAEHAKRRRKQ